MRQIPNYVGEDIHEVAERALVVAVDCGQPVWFEFNGERLQVEQNETVTAIVDRFRAAYQETRRRKQARD